MMEDYVIITHTDCDGILSAAQLRSALGQKVPVFFPEWVEYGVFLSATWAWTQRALEA